MPYTNCNENQLTHRLQLRTHLKVYSSGGWMWEAILLGTDFSRTPSKMISFIECHRDLETAIEAVKQKALKSLLNAEAKT